MSKTVKIVMLGSSYLFKEISLAGAAQHSPRRKAGSEPSWGCVEKRADIAQTAKIRTGGTLPALERDKGQLMLVTWDGDGYRNLLMKLGLCRR